MSETTERLHFAYGSNLSFAQMDSRCPDNTQMGIGTLHGYRWIISSRGYANVVKSDSDYVMGRIYKINKRDEDRLDKKEGYNSIPSCYDKETLSIIADGVSCDCFVYVDPVIQEGPPKNEYIDKINAGLVDSKFPDEYVEKYIRNKIPLIKKSRDD
jgi:gamma-glutamylcyclotransferase